MSAPLVDRLRAWPGAEQGVDALSAEVVEILMREAAATIDELVGALSPFAAAGDTIPTWVPDLAQLSYGTFASQFRDASLAIAKVRPARPGEAQS